MGDSKKGQIIIDQPGMTSVVTKEYLVIPFTDVLIHKKLFAAWTLFLFVAYQVIWGAVLGVEAVAAFYIALLTVAWEFHLAHPLMFAVDAATIGLLIGILYWNYHRYGQKHLTQEERVRLQLLRRVTGGDVQDE